MAESLHLNVVVNGLSQVKHASVSSEFEQFCFALGGKTPIHSILIENIGMAAVKYMHSIRTWAYETFGLEKAILLIAMATPEDLKINAEHIRIADQIVDVHRGTNNNRYANVQLIIEASKNLELPDALKAKGIIFIGPPAAPISALGDKIGSSLVAQAVGVPTLPWSGSHVKISVGNSLDSISDDIYCEACVYTAEEALASC